MKKVLLDIIHDPKAAAAIGAAILALIAGVWGPFVQLRIGKKQAAAAQRAADAAMLAAQNVGVVGLKQSAAAQQAADAGMLTAQNAGIREIARMRLAWMDKLRDTVSEFHSILMIRENVDKEKEAEKLSRLGTQIDAQSG